MSDDVHGLSAKVIVESGSNANGAYIRYGDGTQECWHSIDRQTSELTTGSHTRIWTLPKPFVGSYHASYQLGVANEGDAEKIQSHTVTRRQSRAPGEMSYRLVLSQDLSSAASDELYALGRWKE